MTPVQYAQFEAIKDEMSRWINRQPEMAQFTVREANQIYVNRMVRELNELIVLHCPKQDREAVKEFAYKYYQLS